MKYTLLNFIRSIVGFAAAMLVFFALELVLDLIVQGAAVQGVSLTTWSAYNTADFHQINNLFNRSLNQLTGVIFTTVAIAVPLTANMYSLKFLEFFIKDPVNAIALTFVILTNANNTWVGTVARGNFIPVIELQISAVMTLLCYALAFPYLYYVFRFLHPDTLLERLATETAAQIAAANQRPARAGDWRARTAESIEHLANIAVRSVDRMDRNTAVESVFALDRVMRRYWLVKGQLGAAWFKAEKTFFLGYATAAITDLTANHSWVEMKLFGQLHQVLGAAIPRMPELASTVAETLRKLGLEPAARSDSAVRELVVEYFNTFVRLALTRRDARSVFTVFNEYRMFAEAINSQSPELGQEIAYYFQYYARIARDMGMTFVVEAVAHDLGALVKVTWSASASNRERLLERFLEFDAQANPPLPGVKKAQAILASYFLLNGDEVPARRIRKTFALLDHDFKRLLQEELLHIKREKYWEINDRRINIDYVPDDQRDKLREFFKGL